MSRKAVIILESYRNLRNVDLLEVRSREKTNTTNGGNTQRIVCLERTERTAREALTAKWSERAALREKRNKPRESELVWVLAWSIIRRWGVINIIERAAKRRRLLTHRQ